MARIGGITAAIARAGSDAILSVETCLMTKLTLAERTYTPEEFLELFDSVGYELDEDGNLVERHVSESSSGIALHIGYLLKLETEKTREARPDVPVLRWPEAIAAGGCVADPDVAA